MFPVIYVLSIDPPGCKTMEIFETGEISLCPRFINFVYPTLFQEKECGHKAIPGVAHKSKLEVFFEFTSAKNQLVVRDSQVCSTLIAEKALADRYPCAFRNMNEYAFLLIK
jgi:hypothetical protein